ncbi:DUF4410 domain-containing protein [Cupriavidus consociatus]|uniref:DUF4410 domain-containing protein n=1 Tax=Cupriavidus consociatus TaxID=2821357 RepID=UPI001AEA74B1|nr:MULTISPECIES: DUF4410 domain-containing protein [unclassified Cupriavidus]MBP0619282.1 DUF4410 domain-containing protein [Cupriavidus sp. LEh25]MDK2655930.1 DUF4410 domain-containing protein [Cupriavidus sp. LEh21]
MRTTLQTLATRTRRLTVAALASGAMLATGCASAGVTGINQVGLLQPVQADVIYVHAFNADAGQVQLDGGLMQKVKMMATGGSAATAQSQAAAEAREQVANEIVRELRAQGLNAVRSDAPAPANANALIVEGDFRKIDEGTSRRRLLVGLGAGKSEVGASIRISYQPANGAPVPLQSFVADVDSGHMPGVAETAGVGAVAGHVAVAAAAGTGVHGVSEVKHDTVYADATRLGDSIAKQVAAASMEEGWMAARPAM